MCLDFYYDWCSGYNNMIEVPLEVIYCQLGHSTNAVMYHYIYSITKKYITLQKIPNQLAFYIWLHTIFAESCSPHKYWYNLSRVGLRNLWYICLKLTAQTTQCMCFFVHVPRLLNTLFKIKVFTTFPTSQYLFVLALTFTRNGLTWHHQLRWPRRERMHSRLDGSVRPH